METAQDLGNGAEPAWRATALVPLLGVMWGTGIILAKVAIDSGVPPLLFASFEAVGIAITAFAICWFRHDFPRLTLPDLRFYAVTGLTLVVLPYSFIYSALAHITGSLASIVQAMTPVFTIALAVLFRMERSVLTRWIGVLLSFAGIFLVVQQQAGPGGLGGFSVWVLVALAAPLSYAVTNVYAAHGGAGRQSATANAAGSNIAAVPGMAVVLAIAAVTSTESLTLSALPSQAIIVGLLAIAANVLASLAFFRLVSLGGATKAGLASYVTVLVGLFSGWAFLAEPVTALACLAAAITVAGVALANRTPHVRSTST